MKKKNCVLSVFLKLERERKKQLKHFLLHLSHTYYTILYKYIIQPKTEY